MKRIKGIEKMKIEDIELLVEKMKIKNCYLEFKNQEIDLIILD